MAKGKKDSKTLKKKSKTTEEESAIEETTQEPQDKDVVEKEPRKYEEEEDDDKDSEDEDSEEDDLHNKDDEAVNDTMTNILKFMENQQKEIQSLKDELKLLRSPQVSPQIDSNQHDRLQRRLHEHARVAAMSTPLVSQRRTKIADAGDSNKNQWTIQIHPEKFTGSKDENVNVWLFQFEQSMELNKVPSSVWTKVSFQYFKENAATWYLSMFTHFDPAQFDWDIFKQELRNAFQPSNYMDKLRDHVFELRQGSDFDAYVQDMRLSLMQLTDMNEIDKIRCFLRGLKKRTKEWISFERPSTLQQAITLATHFEYSHYGGKSDVTKPKNEKRSKPVECHYCHRTGHYSNECKKKERDRKENKQVKNTDNLKNTERFDDRKKEIQNVLVNQEKVSRNNLDEMENVFIVSGKLNNMDARILIDTGANTNIVSQHFVKKLGVVPRRTGKTLEVKLGESGVTKRIIEKNILLDVEMQDMPINKERFVCMNINYDAIMGFPWFYLNFKEMVEKFPVNMKMISKKSMKKEIKRGESVFLAQVLVNHKSIIDPDSKINQIIALYSDIISNDVPSIKTSMKHEHVIELNENYKIPKKKMYRLSPREKNVMNQQIKELLDKGLIQPSKSPFGAPVIFAKKADGSLRMCIDYRELNQQTKTNRFPLPNIQDLFDLIGNAKFFTKLDLKSGYHQIRMSKNSIEITGFCTPYGHYEWLVMPFGLSNAPSTFQFTMNEILKEFLNVFVVVYLDDILIFSNTEEEHLKHVKLVLDVLKQNEFTLAKSKCVWMKDQINYLGHVIGKGEIKPEDEKIKIIEKWRTPQNVKEVQKFIGFLNYYNKYINNFASLAKPLFNLMKKNVKFEWKKEHDNSFHELKQSLIKYQKLVTVDINEPFYVYTDASNYAIGAVLMQDRNGEKVTVSMRSRLLKNAELNYSTYDKELLAIHDAFKHWRCYLDGSKITFYTDHNPITHVMKQSSLNNRQTRWISDLWNQDLTIKYIPGKKNVLADALSRMQINHIHVLKLDDEIQNLKEEYIKDAKFSLIWRLLNEGVNKNDNEITKTKLISYKKHFKLENERIYFKDQDGNLRLCLPHGAIREKIVSIHHDSMIGGHQGIARTYDAMVKRFYFPKMKKYIERYIKSCVPCQRNKSKNKKNIGLLNPLETPNKPWETISMDFVVKLPKTKSGFDSIVVFVDKLTKRTIMRPCKVSDTAEDVAKIYIDAVVREHGISKHIISDRDAKFTSNFWRSFTSRLGINLKMSTAFHPETDGQTERANRTIQDCLRHYVNFEQDNWDELLAPVEYVINSAKQASTGYSPFELDYGREVLYPTDLLLNRLNEKEDHSSNSLIEIHRMKIRDAIEAMTTAKINQEIYANKDRRDHEFKKGDKVFLRTRNYLSGEQKFRPKKKLSAKWAGPFVISEVISHTAFRLDLPPKWKIHNVFHCSNLWPAVVSDEFKQRDKFQPPPDIIDGVEEYEVERIINKRTNKKTGRIEFLVVWRGHPDDVSWESEENVSNCEELINELYENNPELRLIGKEVKEKKEKSKVMEKADVEEKLVSRKSTRVRKKKNLKDYEINYVLLRSVINLGEEM